nr:gliding motility-associated C-terminal domain-containing protein [uncultured Allomuricauda sp.]
MDGNITGRECSTLIFFLFPLLTFFGGRYAMSQTVNTGNLYVSADTDFFLGMNFQNTGQADFINDGRLYVYGDFVNQGLVDFIDDGAEVHFSGSSPQNIQGSDVNYLRFSKIYFENGDGFHHEGEVRVAEMAYFDEGVIDGEGVLLFEEGASVAGASQVSHADLEVYKEGGNAFEFPVGDAGYYRPLLLEGIENVSESFKVRYLFESPDQLYSVESMDDGLELVGDTEYWQLERVSGSGSVTLTLGWNENTTSSELIDDEGLNAIRVVRWDADLNQWVDMGGVVDVVEGTVSVPAVDQFGVFALAKVKVDGEVVLNDELIYNGVTPNGDGVNDYFYIEDIGQMPNNVVQVYNRWSIKVFETRDYDSSGNVFDGFAESGLTFGGARLPGGTYYYLISFDATGDDGSVKRVSKMGYLYINY